MPAFQMTTTARPGRQSTVQDVESQHLLQLQIQKLEAQLSTQHLSQVCCPYMSFPMLKNAHF